MAKIRQFQSGQDKENLKKKSKKSSSHITKFQETINEREDKENYNRLIKASGGHYKDELIDGKLESCISFSGLFHAFHNDPKFFNMDIIQVYLYWAGQTILKCLIEDKYELKNDDLYLNLIQEPAVKDWFESFSQMPVSPAY